MLSPELLLLPAAAAKLALAGKLRLRLSGRPAPLFGALSRAMQQQQLSRSMQQLQQEEDVRGGSATAAATASGAPGRTTVAVAAGAWAGL